MSNQLLSLKEILRLTASDGCAKEAEQAMNANDHTETLVNFGHALAALGINPCNPPKTIQAVADAIKALVQEVKELKRDLAASVVKSRELEAENSKLRSALSIVHFKREPWQ